ncbi:MAG: type II secretion system protein [Verrucomicrobiota bacterium]
MNKNRNGFSLVEVLTAVGIIGIILFLALPNIVKVKEDSEINLAITRAEAFNMSMASYIQTNGHTKAANLWAAAADDDARYQLVRPYLAFAPTTRAQFMPSGFEIVIEDTLTNINKVPLKYAGTGGANIPY